MSMRNNAQYCFCCAACVLVLVWSKPALAKAQDTSVRIGLLTWSDCKVDSYLRERGEFGPFVRGLRELRYNVPQSLTSNAVAVITRLTACRRRLSNLHSFQWM